MSLSQEAYEAQRKLLVDEVNECFERASKCGFTLNAVAKHAPFACEHCGSRKFRAQLTMTADANPSYSAPDGTVPVIRANMDVYAVLVQCEKCSRAIPCSGYTHE
jgi:hypothetical protein